MKNAVFWNVMPRGSCNNRRFGGMYRLHHQGDKNRRPRNNVSSEYNQSALRRAARRNIPEDGILHNHRNENFISYILMMEAIRSTETSILRKAT
jgi:uncharacterized membrane protein YccC